jgi:cell division protein FtsB
MDIEKQEQANTTLRTDIRKQEQANTALQAEIHRLEQGNTTVQRDSEARTSKYDTPEAFRSTNMQIRHSR